MKIKKAWPLILTLFVVGSVTAATLKLGSPATETSDGVTSTSINFKNTNDKLSASQFNRILKIIKGISADGDRIGIGLSGSNSIPASSTLHVEGNALVTDAITAGGHLYTSDQRLKKNIQTIEFATDIVQNLRGVTFDWKKTNESSVGFVAQEVEEVLPQVVETDTNGYKSVGYGNVTAVLVEAIKELIQENKDLKLRLEALESKVK